jgi:hypothetical protein
LTAIGEEFLYCVKAAGFASRRRGLRTGMRPSAGPALGHIDKTKGRARPGQERREVSTIACLGKVVFMIGQMTGFASATRLV